jgi:hypothetical protein
MKAELKCPDCPFTTKIESVLARHLEREHDARPEKIGCIIASNRSGRSGFRRKLFKQLTENNRKPGTNWNFLGYERTGLCMTLDEAREEVISGIDYAACKCWENIDLAGGLLSWQILCVEDRTSVRCERQRSRKFRLRRWR